MPSSFFRTEHVENTSVFIKGYDVDAVLGLHQGIDELVHRSRLPLYVQTVLLPFKGKIVFDGMFQAYNIHFGAGIIRNL